MSSAAQKAINSYLSIAVIQIPKPDLIPGFYLNRLLRLHTQPILISTIGRIHIRHEDSVPLSVEFGMDPADGIVRKHIIDAACHFAYCTGKLLQFDMLLVPPVYRIQFIFCHPVFIIEYCIAIIIGLLWPRRS